MIVERVTNAAAVGATVSPWWLVYIQPVSDIAAALLPIAGVTWLVLQIANRIHDRVNKNNKKKDKDG